VLDSRSRTDTLPWGALVYVLRGKSLTRAALNHLVAERVVLTGDVLDMGAGLSPSYRPLLNNSARSLKTLDAAVPTADVQVDLERVPIDVPSGSFDTILAFNLLEHIYRHRELVHEIARLLRPGGRVFIWVPFLIEYHPDPHDHFRYTDETLLRLLDEAQFEDVTVHGYGGRFTASAALALGGVPTRAGRLLLALFGLAFDRLYYQVARVSQPRHFSLGYLATGRRPYAPALASTNP
jgi:SAM-dependent methyltransferase